MTVSIVIPVYNRADLLPRAMASALAQTDTDFEIVVVDDGSTDDTAAVVRGFTDPRVRYQRQANAGVSAARNAGAALARGELLLFLDSDDELAPSALAQFGAAARANGWSVVLSGWVHVSADGLERRPCGAERVGSQPQLVGPFLPGAFVVDAGLFAATGGYDEHLRFSENTVLGWRIREALVARSATIGTVEEPLVVRYSQPERRYDEARYDAAVWILEHYGDQLASGVTGAGNPRKRRANFLAVAGANAAVLGRPGEAWRYSLAALSNDPGNLSRYRGVLGVARTTVGALVKRDAGRRA